MVYVISKDGKPLMPTARHGKVRRLLKAKQAVVVKRCPFTIRLLFKTGNVTQPISLGIDAGSRHVGASATTETRVLYEADAELRDDIVKKLSTRRELRRGRRNRKTRYRAPRFDNRRRHDGWLAPSVSEKVESHITIVDKVCKILPISKIIVETASFDIQKIKNPNIGGKGYQQGDQLGFWNVREYVLFRDGHQCQCCKGKSKDKILNVHHIESRQTGGNAPNNLITLCETCHKGYHAETVKLPKAIKRGRHFRDAAFMGIMRWAFYNRLKDKCETNGIPVHMTFGYITKNTRIRNKLPKEHFVDARCISGHPQAMPPEEVFFQRKVRCHNRQTHKQKVLLGGARKRNQASYQVKGFRLFDKVAYGGKEYFVFGRREKGYFDIRNLSGETVNKGSIGCSKLKFLEPRQTWLNERRIGNAVYTDSYGYAVQTA